MVIAAMLLLGARTVVLLQPSPEPTSTEASQLVLIGVAGRRHLDSTDRSLLRSHPNVVAVGTVAMPRAGACATADWATLGAGRTADVGSLCSVEVGNAQVQDWATLLAAVRAHDGDARLGTLGGAAAGCVAAVGSGAALAAARPDGSLAQFQTFAGYLDGGARSTCPITLVDAAQQSGAVVQDLVDHLVARTGTGVIVAGIGPSPDPVGPELSLLYTISDPPAGWLSSSSTRQPGLVTLPDLTATLLNVGRPAGDGRSLPTDGSTLTVAPALVTPETVGRRLRTLEHRSGALTRAADEWVALTFAALVLAALGAGRVTRRRGLAAFVGSVAVVAPAALSLVGAVPWYRSGAASLVLGLTLLGLFAVLMLVSSGITRWCRLPPAVAGSVLTVIALSVDAVTGGLMQRGSLLNLWPMDGGRWYGFGNVTFAVYATAGLVVIGHLTVTRGQRPSRSSVVAAALIAVMMLICEGWPGFGADFGGLLTLGPPLAWLLATTRWSRWPPTLAVVAGSAAAVAAAVLVAWLDWSRGPGARSYLGTFVQRLLDAEAGGLLLRKATAVLSSVSTPIGVAVIALGMAVWFVVLTRVGARSSAPWWHPRVSAAVLSTAVLGTLLNDSGVAVFATVTAAYAITVSSDWIGADHGRPRPPVLLGVGRPGRRRAGRGRDGGPGRILTGRDPSGVRLRLPRSYVPQRVRRGVQPAHSPRS